MKFNITSPVLETDLQSGAEKLTFVYKICHTSLTLDPTMKTMFKFVLY